MRQITSRQMDVLGVVSSVGTVTPNEVGTYHLPIGASSAWAALNSLERRGLVEPFYTGHSRGRAFQITADGEAILEAEGEQE